MDEVTNLREKYPHLKGVIHKSPRIWHRKFPCKLKFNGAVSSSEVWYWLGFKYGFPMPTVHDIFRFRSGKHITLYFKSFNDATDAVEHFNNRLLDVSVLACEETVKILEKDRKLRLKKHLYFKQYHHKIIFYYVLSQPDSQTEEIKKWVITMFDFKEHSNMLRNDRIWFRWNQQEPTMFLTNEDDITLIKLAWGEYFNTIETIQLINDLGENK